MHIKEESELSDDTKGKLPDIIFMKNHGIIASHDDYEKTIEIHEKANRRIADYFIVIRFPEANIEKKEYGFISKTDLIKDFILEFDADEAYFNVNSLYPDQVVYLRNKLGKTIFIDKQSGTINYKMKKSQAQTLEEIILSVSYIISEINKSDSRSNFFVMKESSFLKTGRA